LEAQYKGVMDITRAGQMGCFDLRRKLKEECLGIVVPSPNESHIMDCPAGERLFVVDLDNKVYPCLYLRNTRSAIGMFADGEIILKKGAHIPGALHADDCPAYIEQHNQTFEV
jgi:MoaA/NifB/PqqE/SkfB family radical SAM enzyme